MKTLNDYMQFIGYRSGWLTVINIEMINNHPIAFCQCCCGNTTHVKLSSIIQQKVLSCGCLVPRLSQMSKGNKAYCDHNNPSIVHVILNNTDEEMLCDYCTWQYLYHLTWFKHKDTGYAATNTLNNSNLYYQRLILACPEGYVRDHINRNRLDNRYENLRIVTQRSNCINRTLNPETGVVGVNLRKDRKSLRYRALINIGVKQSIRRTFADFDEAVKWRKEMEEKYYTIESLSTKRMVQEIGPVYIIDKDMIAKTGLEDMNIMYPCPEFIESQ